MARECGFEVLSVITPKEKQSFNDAENLSAIGKIKARRRFFSDKVSEICELVASRLDDQSILIAPPFAYVVAKLLHSKYGVPYISTMLAPANLLSLKNPSSIKALQWFTRLPYSVRKALFHGVERLVIDPIFRMLLKEPVRKLDLPLPSRVFSQWCHSPQRIVGLFPDWFCPTPEDWPAQVTLTGFPLFHPNAGEQKLSTGLSQFLDAGPPPIVFTAGTETRKPRDFFEAALKAVQALGVRGVFLTRLTDQLPQLPDTVWHESYTSLNLLLSRASVLVHHGGIGTTAQALHAGIPQLVLPGTLDQLDNAEHIEGLGCGLAQQNLLNSSAVIKKLRYLQTTSQVKDACHATQAKMEPGAKACRRAANVIEEMFCNVSKAAALE
jgi:rhamnosyltransferase subunit B